MARAQRNAIHRRRSASDNARGTRGNYLSEGAPRRICIVMMSAVGDAVHVLPVINALKRANPATHITWVLQPGPASLVRDHPSVDEVVLFDRTLGFGAFTSVRRALKQRKFDLVINLQVYFKAGIVTAM